MEVKEVLQKVGGIEGLRRLVAKRHPYSGQFGIPRERDTFEKFLDELQYVCAMRGVTVEAYLEKHSHDFFELARLAGLHDPGYQSKTGKRLHGDD